MKIIFKVFLIGLILPFSALAQTLPVLISVPPRTVKNALTNPSLTVPLSVTNLGPVPLQIYMAATATASPANRFITVDVTETVVFTPSQLGGDPTLGRLNIYNHKDISTGAISIDLLPSVDILVRVVKFSYDEWGNRTNRYMSTENYQTILNGIPNPLGRIAMPHDTVKPLISLYPNPTAGPMTIKIDEGEMAEAKEMKLTLFDFTGRAILERKVSANQSEIDFSPFAAGAYKLKLVYGDKQKVYTVLKEN